MRQREGEAPAEPGSPGGSPSRVNAARSPHSCCKNTNVPSLLAVRMSGRPLLSTSADGDLDAYAALVVDEVRFEAGRLSGFADETEPVEDRRGAGFDVAGWPMRPAALADDDVE